MHVRHVQDALMVTYLLLLAAAYFVTMTHIFPPVFEGPVHFVYGMMAPYQGASDRNTELVLLGHLPSGAVQSVDMRGYFPGLHGEQNSRQNLDQFVDSSMETLGPVYEQFLAQILSHEKDKGNAFIRLSLFRERWPHSTDGYTAGRSDGVERTFLLSYP